MSRNCDSQKTISVGLNVIKFLGICVMEPYFVQSFSRFTGIYLNYSQKKFIWRFCKMELVHYISVRVSLLCFARLGVLDGYQVFVYILIKEIIWLNE